MKKNKKKMLSKFLFVSPIAIVLPIAVACTDKNEQTKNELKPNNVDEQEQEKEIVVDEQEKEVVADEQEKEVVADEQEKETTLETQQIRKKEFIQSIIKKLSEAEPLDATKVKDILEQIGVTVLLNNGTSKKNGGAIGDKHKDISEKFIPSFAKLTPEERNKLTIETFASLFQDESNEKFRIKETVIFLLEKAFGGEPTKKPQEQPKKDIEPLKPLQIATSVSPRTTINDYEFEDEGKLKYDDSFWSLDNLNYQNEANIGEGQTHYANLQLKENVGYPQFNIEDWINVYDSKIENVLADPKHSYSDESPDFYEAKNIQFASIYHHPGLEITRTGNNNNGLNALYSGSYFEVDENNKQRTFDTSSVQTLDEMYFNPTKAIHNGWEHVSPQSQTKKVWESRDSNILNKANGDLHNLRPSIQNLFNQPRSNNAFGMVVDSVELPNSYGVDFEIGNSDFNYEVVEPRVNVRGDIARIMFYMHDRYHIKYDLDYYRQLALWAAMDPVTNEERKLDERIAQVMGFSNDYVTGLKQIPYDQEIEQKVQQANNDKKENDHFWDIAPQKVLQNEISSLEQAQALDWSQANLIEYGISPSETEIIKEGGLNKQIILQLTMESDQSKKYFKVKATQKKAIIAREFGKDYDIKIGINNGGSLKTFLGKHSLGINIPWKEIIEPISEIKYLVVE